MTINSSLVAITNPRSSVTEAYRTLQTNLNFALHNKEKKTITITSPGISEGKSTSVANLGITFSQNRKRTLIVDCDFRCPRLHSLFQVSNQKGISNVLCHNEQVEDVIQPINKYLDLLTTGPLPANPVGLLNSNRMKKFIEQISDSYDTVIFDTPPIGIFTDAALIGSKTDGVLLVVATGKSEVNLTIKAKENLQNVKANLLGVVMTMMPINKKDSHDYYNQQEKRKTSKKKRRLSIRRKTR